MNTTPLLRTHWGIILLLVFTALLYQRIGNFDFLLYDDNRYVTGNYDIQDLSWDGIRKMFNNPQYFEELIPPLTSVSMAVNYSISGYNPSGYHLANLLFHLANVFLVWLLVFKLSNRQDMSLFVAAIFAFHPVIVEAVAWISARKEVQYTFFYLLATFSAIKFWENKKIHWYILTFLLFLLSYHSKYAAASFPIWYVTLAFIWKKRKDYGRIALESIAFFILPLRSLWLSFQGSHTPSISTNAGEIESQIAASSEVLYNSLSFIQKISLGGYSLLKYLVNFLFPINQQIIYPYPQLNETGGLPTNVVVMGILGWLLFFAGIYLLYISYRKKRSLAVFGLLVFGVHVLLLMHILPLGGRVVIADRYMYFPQIGLGILLFLLISENLNKYPNYLLGSIILGCAFLTHLRLPNWENTQTVFTHLAENEPNYATARVLIGTYHYEKGKKPEAIEEFQKTLELDSNNFVACINLAAIFIEKNQYPEAEKLLKRGLQIESEHAGTYYNLALIYLRQNIYHEALKYFKEAVKYEDFGGFHHLSHYNIASIYQQLGHTDLAIEHYELSVERKPNFAKAYHRLAINFNQKGLQEKAIENAQKAIQNDPNLTDARMDLLKLLSDSQNYKQLLNQAEIAIKRMPNDARGYYYRGLAYFGMKAFSEACNDWATASNIDEAKKLLAEYCDR